MLGALQMPLLYSKRFESQLEKHHGQLVRSAVELAKEWRSDRALRKLEAMLVVANEEASLIISGTGDVIETRAWTYCYRFRW